MFKSYLRTTFRYLWKNKTSSYINIFGLAIGICVCFFALLYVQFELRRDDYNTKAERIYRLVTDVKTAAGTSYESTPAPMAPAMQNEFPEIKEAARVFMDDMIIQSNPDDASKQEIAYTDASVFKIFSWPLLRGDAAHLFDAPFDVVLSQSAAKKYFGSRDPLGQTLTINGRDRAAVTGVMKDIPYDSHLKVDMLLSMSTLINADWDHNWTRFGFYTYLLFKPGQDMPRFRSKLPAFVRTNFDQSRAKYILSIEPLKNVYLYGKPRGHRTGSSASGSLTYVYIVSVIALLVLFIACFNFINLSTALSMQRAREIGVRKVLGASKNQLVLQFFTDTLVLCLISFIIALSLAVMTLPLFNGLAGTVISVNLFEHIQNAIWFFLIALAVGVLSGIYPALVLSGFNPVSTLKGKIDTGAGGPALRKALVVGQFSISIFLIIGTLVVYQQLDFMQNKQAGFQKDQKLVADFQFDQRISLHADAIKQQLMAIPGVASAGMSYCIPGTPGNEYKTIIEDSNDEKQEIRANAYFVDADFLKQYQIKLIAGRGFAVNAAADTLHSMLINETLAGTLGYNRPQDAIGKRFSQLNQQGTIIGVVKDFHYQSFLQRIQPLTIRLDPGHFTFLTVDISTANVIPAVAKLEAAWKKIAPGLPFVYFFADEAYNQQYLSEQRFGRLFVCFSAIAVLISCLGLFGLSVFSTAQRKKEIGIRRVLGARVSGIILMLSQDFVKLIALALVIVSPLSWWIMNLWLQRFAYRVSIPMWVFLFSGGAAIVIALFTISFQAVKAAIANPLSSIKE